MEPLLHAHLNLFYLLISLYAANNNRTDIITLNTRAQTPTQAHACMQAPNTYLYTTQNLLRIITSEGILPMCVHMSYICYDLFKEQIYVTVCHPSKQLPVARM